MQKDIIQENEKCDYQMDVVTKDSANKSELHKTYYSKLQEDMTKEEREWFILVLIILGIAIITCASVSAAFSGGGLFIGIEK